MPRFEQAREWYPARDPVHGIDHVGRVHSMAERLARELGADDEVVRAAALLHDVEGAAPDENGGRERHELASAEFARRVLAGEGWPRDRIEEVLHCIRSHRYRGQERPETLEAQILFDADKLDVIGAFGVARTIGYAIQAGQPVYAPPSQRFLDRGEREADEPHSAYHEYLFKLRQVRERLHTEAARRLAEEREKVLHEFFQQLAREAQDAPGQSGR